MLKEKVDEVRKLAGEKGFKYHTSTYSSEDYELLNIFIRLTHIQKWLRDEHKIFVHVEPVLDECVIFMYVIKTKNDNILTDVIEEHNTFEVTLLKGIEKALTYI